MIMRKISLLGIVLFLLCSVIYADDLTNEMGAIYEFETDPYTTDLNDSVGGNNSLSDITYGRVTGIKNYGWKFYHGVYSAIRLPPFLNGTEQLSYSGWFKFDDLSNTEQTVIGMRTVGGYHSWGGIRYSNLYWVQGWNSSYNTYTNDSYTLNVDKWYHIGLSYNESGNMKVYFNGLLSGIVYNVSNILDIDDYVSIGAIGSTLRAYNFDGVIDEVYFWNRVLTDSEFQTLGVNTSAGFYPFSSDTASPIVDITFPDNNVSIKGTEFNISFQFNNFNATQCDLMTNYTGVYASCDNIKESTYNVTTQINTTSYNISLPSYVIGYWRFEEGSGSIANDSSYLAQHGTIHGTANYNTSKDGNYTGDYSIEMDKNDDWIDIPDTNGHYSFGDNVKDVPFSMGAWIYMNDATGFRLLSKRIIAMEYLFGTDGSDNLFVQLYDESTANYIGRKSTPITSHENEWIHVAMTYNGSGSSNGIDLYINGVIEDVSNSQAGSYIAMNDENIQLEIGSFNDGGVLSDGLIDEVFITDIALTQNQIIDIYNNGLYINTTFVNSTNITTTYNGTQLNTSTNYTLSCTPTFDLNSIIKYYINCNDINSTEQLINFDNDFTPPIITLIYPEENNRSWSQDINLTFTTNELTDCIIDNVNFLTIIDNNTYYVYKETTLINGFYTVNITCTDISNNNISEIVLFTKDKQFPVIKYKFPLPDNTTVFNINDDKYLKINLTDDIDLYYFHTNLTYYNDLYEKDILLFENEFNLTGVVYYYIEVLNNISFPNNTIITSNSYVCDSHTKEKLEKLKPPINTKNYIKFDLGKNKYLRIEAEESKGTKVICLAGKIKRPGVVEVPIGLSMKELIYEIGGGCENDAKLKAVLTGGPAGGCVPAEMLDTPLDYETLQELGSIMGSGGFVVLTENDCMVDVARYFMNFSQEESCGKCTPCREGTKRLLDMLTCVTRGNGGIEYINKIEQLAEFVRDTALCGLGQNAPNPILSTLKHFKDEYIAHVKDKTCPSGACANLLTFTINDKCIGCGNCARHCPVECISGKLKEAHLIDQDKCIKCGACVENCAFAAIDKV